MNVHEINEAFYRRFEATLTPASDSEVNDLNIIQL